MYPKDLCLEVETTGLEQVFLNLTLKIVGNKLRIYMYNQNYEYTLDHTQEQAVLRVGPYFPMQWSRQAIRLYLQTRIATLLQLYHQGVNGLDRAFTELLVELIRLQVPTRVIYKILKQYSGLRSHQVIDSARRRLQNIAAHIQEQELAATTDS